MSDIAAAAALGAIFVAGVIAAAILLATGHPEACLLILAPAYIIGYCGEWLRRRWLRDG